MKAFKHSILLLLGTLLLLSFSYKSKMGIQIKKGQVTVHGKIVGSPWALADFTSQLGIADRKRDGYNITHTYDSKGIVLFEIAKDSVPTGMIAEVQFYLSSGEGNAVTPSGFYTGSLVVDRLALSSSVSAAVLRSKLKKWTEGKSYMEHNYRFAKDGIYIYFQYNDKDERLIKVSIGQEVRS